MLQFINFVTRVFISGVISKNFWDALIQCSIQGPIISLHKGHYSYGNLNNQDYQQEHCKLKTIHLTTTAVDLYKNLSYFNSHTCMQSTWILFVETSCIYGSCPPSYTVHVLKKILSKFNGEIFLEKLTLSWPRKLLLLWTQQFGSTFRTAWKLVTATWIQTTHSHPILFRSIHYYPPAHA